MNRNAQFSILYRHHSFVGTNAPCGQLFDGTQMLLGSGNSDPSHITSLLLSLLLGCHSHRSNSVITLNPNKTLNLKQTPKTPKHLNP